MTTRPALEPYATDLKALIEKGHELHATMQYACYPDKFREARTNQMGEDAAARLIDNLPYFGRGYQTWYSEAKALIRQLLPDRLEDFTRHYEKPKSRKRLTYSDYTIEDYLQNTVNNSVDMSAAIPRFRQQLFIVEAVEARLTSSLFDIRQLSQADLFDSDIEAARTLAKNGFLRAAGAVTGVVLEKHLKEVCANHDVRVRKQRPQIADLNDLLKQADVIDTPQWRLNQRLGDLRNLCAHDRESEPTSDQVDDLIDGVDKVIKTLF